MNRGDLLQLSGHVTNPANPYTVVRDRGCKARHVRQDRLATISDRTRGRAKKIERILDTTTRVGHAEQKITISSGLCCRFGS